ncbi:hypothetical protein L7F22_050282 [Adiantum nelumboides]|nr:hypothetical protein [Adiantum nelumboides]
MAKGGLVKVVARNAGPLGAKAVDQPELAQRATKIFSTATQSFDKRAVSAAATSKAVEDTSKNYSGLTPIEVLLVLAVLLGLFVLLLIVGELCKVFNKPRKEAAPYTQQKLYQPSAAGYGTRAATNTLQVPKGGGKGQGSRLSLLQFASPMGTGGRTGDETVDTSFETPTVSSHSGQGDYFGKKSNGHTRGQSSGVQLPGAATMASSRKGPGAHPMLNGNSTFAPDGSGFKPGQPVNFAGYAGPNSPTSPGQSAPMVPGQGNVPSHARVGMGRPPAADARRKSRYSRAISKRIDSMGPGQLRKSLYAGADDDPMNSDLYGMVGNRKSKMIRKPSTEDRSTDEIQGTGGGAGLRRIDSMGKGDARRKSQVQSIYRSSRAISVYNPKNNEKAIFLSAQADNFGAGRTDPLGARSSPGVNGSLMLPHQQGQEGRLRSGSGSSNAGQSYGQRTPGSSSEPLVQQSPNNTQYSYSSQQQQQQQSYDSSYSMPPNQTGGFKPGALMPSGANAPIGYSQPMMQQESQQSMAAYPGGGAPRIRPRQMAM